MRPEPFTAFRQALRLGPGYCPPDLFQGSVPAIVRGLKVHANNISHARHMALEDSYPRLVRLMGLKAFHAVAEAFLDLPNAQARSLDNLGDGLERLLEDPTHRDLARAEWAWLEAFHAAEHKALGLAELAAMKAEELAGATFALHPATRMFPLEQPERFAWDEPLPGAGDMLLLTRPKEEVMLRRIGSIAAELLALLARKQPADAPPDSAALITLIDAGALILETHP